MYVHNIIFSELFYWLGYTEVGNKFILDLKYSRLIYSKIVSKLLRTPVICFKGSFR